MQGCPSGCSNDGTCFCTGGGAQCDKHWNQCEGKRCENQNQCAAGLTCSDHFCVVGPALAPAGWTVFATDAYCTDPLARQRGGTGVTTLWHDRNSTIVLNNSQCRARCTADSTCSFYLWRYDTDAALSARYTCAGFSTCPSTYPFADGDGGNIYQKICRAADTAGWEDSRRYTCASYVTNGWCLDARYDITGTGGAQANCAQCCVLSGGAAPTGGSTPRTPATTEGTDHNNNNTGAGASAVSILAGLAGSVASTTGAAIAVAASSSIVAGAVISVAVAPALAAVAGVGGGAASGGVSSMGGAGVDVGAASFLLEHLQSLALLSRLPTIQQCGGDVFSMVTGGSLAWSNLHLPLPAAAEAAFGLSSNDTNALGGEGDGGESGTCGGSSIPEIPPKKGQRRRRLRLFGQDSWGSVLVNGTVSSNPALLLNASNWMAGMSGQGCHSILATLSASIKGSVGATAGGTGGNDANGVNSTAAQAAQQHKKSESLLKKAKALLFGNLFWATLIFISLMSLHATIAYALAGRCGSLCTKGYSKHMRRWLS